MKTRAEIQRQAGCGRHGTTCIQRMAVISVMAVLIGALTLFVGCGKKEPAPPATPPQVQETPPQPVAPAPVQREQYAPQPPPRVQTAPAPQNNPAPPTGVPMTRPAGASKPVPVVP